MIHLFVLQNWSIILVHEGKWKMSNGCDSVCTGPLEGGRHYRYDLHDQTTVWSQVKQQVGSG